MCENIPVVFNLELQKGLKKKWGQINRHSKTILTFASEYNT